MNAQDVLKTYAMFYVSENDDFNSAKKLDMLNFIEQADEVMIMDLFENNEIESPEGLLESDPYEEKSALEVIGESAITMMVLDEASPLHSFDMWKNSLKDLLGQKTSLKYKLIKADYQMRPKISRAISKIDDKIDALKDKIASASKSVAKGAESAGEKAGELASKAHDTLKDTKKAVWKGAGDVGKKAGEKLEDVGKSVKGATDQAGKAVEKGAKAVRDVAGDVGEKVSGAAGKAADFAKDQPGAVGAAVAAAAALTAGVMAYRKFFSKAAKACSGAPDKKACLAQYKMKAKQAQISALNSGKAKCAKSKNPATCKAKIDSKISALKAKK